MALSSFVARRQEALASSMAHGQKWSLNAGQRPRLSAEGHDRIGRSGRRRCRRAGCSAAAGNDPDLRPLRGANLGRPVHHHHNNRHFAFGVLAGFTAGWAAWLQWPAMPLRHRGEPVRT